MGSNFNDRILKRAQELNLPLSAHIMLTERCDLACIHCYLPKKRSPAVFSLAELDALFNQLREAGTLAITLSGGEATMHRDFLAAAKLVRAKHLVLELYTNLNSVDRRMAGQIAELHPFSISTSIYGSTAERHDAITKVQGSFGRTVASIGYLKRLGVRVRVKTPLFGQNADDFEAIKRLVAEDLGAESDSGVPYIFPPQGNAEKQARFMCGEPEIEGVCSPVPEEETERSRLEQPLCGAGRTYVSIGSDGSVYPCPMFSEAVGNIHEQRFADIWRNASLLNKMRSLSWKDLEECSTCGLINFCVRCTASVYSATGEFTLPDLQACRIAKVRSGQCAPKIEKSA